MIRENAATHPSDDYEVGYGKPPVYTRFRPGQSGNPRGSSRAARQGRAKRLALAEAYRPVTIREGNTVLRLPAIQAIFRSQIALAAKGDGRAQRDVIASVQAIEAEIEKDIPQQTRITVQFVKPEDQS